MEKEDGGKRETAHLGKQLMTKKTWSTDAGCGARRSAVKDPARCRGQTKKIEGTERNSKPGNFCNVEETKTPSQPLSILLYFLSQKKPVQ